jgi:hypothetical protein
MWNGAVVLQAEIYTGIYLTRVKKIMKKLNDRAGVRAEI